MLVEQIDGCGLESLERTFDGFLDLFRSTIQAGRTRPRIPTQIESELCGNHHPVAIQSESFAEQFLIGVRP